MFCPCFPITSIRIAGVFVGSCFVNGSHLAVLAMYDRLNHAMYHRYTKHYTGLATPVQYSIIYFMLSIIDIARRDNAEPTDD